MHLSQKANKSLMAVHTSDSTPSLAKVHTYSAVQTTCGNFNGFSGLNWLNCSVHSWCHPCCLLLGFLFPCRHVGELGVAATAAAYSLAREPYNFHRFLKPLHGQYWTFKTLRVLLSTQNASVAVFVQTSLKVWQPLGAHPLPLSIRSCMIERR